MAAVRRILSVFMRLSLTSCGPHFRAILIVVPISLLVRHLSRIRSLVLDAFASQLLVPAKAIEITP